MILAAGLGGRLGRATSSLPKPLVPVAGRPLIAYTLDALAAAGIEDVVVVTGYREQQLRAALLEVAPARTRFVSNPRFEGGAARSLAAAREACGDDAFLLLMSDHLFDGGLVATLAALELAGGAAVAADASRWPAEYVGEATRLLVDDGGLVREIGKGLPAFTHLDAGAFVCTADTWMALDAVGRDASLSEVFGVLAKGGQLRAADITGAFWYDVDTPEDREAAEELLAARAVCTA